MKTIALHPAKHGKVAVVDDEDFDELNAFHWQAVRRRRPSGDTLNWYAMRSWRSAGARYSVLMHRQIVAASDGEEVDHKDSDGLNNQRTNLRRCTRLQNAHNTRDRPGSSSFKGVSWHKGEGRWRATIKAGGRQIHLGLYDDEEQAARVYDQNARTMFGDFARLNFPGDVAPVVDSRHSKSSQFRGVTFLPKARAKPWRALIKVDGKSISIGTFATEEDAALAYNARRMDLVRKLNAIAGGARLKPSRAA